MFFFFNDTATTEIYTLSLHDALPIFGWLAEAFGARWSLIGGGLGTVAGALLCATVLAARFGRDALYNPGSEPPLPPPDRKSTRLNSSHANISYAVFCLKKKKTNAGI